MDRPVLHAFVRELLALERLQSFAAALPARARVSEPVLPLLLATLHEQLERGLVCLLPEDADARDAAEAAGWFVGAGPRRAAARARCPLGLGARAAAAPRRRAGACARRARGATGSSSPRRPPSPKVCLRSRSGRSRCGSTSAPSRASTVSPSRSRSRAMNGSTGPRSAASSRCAVGSSTSSRRPAASRCESSSTATRSNRCAPSRPSRSGRSIPSRARSSIRRSSGART